MSIVQQVIVVDTSPHPPRQSAVVVVLEPPFLLQVQVLSLPWELLIAAQQQAQQRVRWRRTSVA